MADISLSSLSVAQQLGALAMGKEGEALGFAEWQSAPMDRSTVFLDLVDGRRFKLTVAEISRMSPIERAARALCHGDPDESIRPIHQAEPKSEAARPLWHTYIPTVRAVLTAIREPSEVMLDAAEDQEAQSASGTAGNMWRAMIDTLLEEGR